MSKPVAVETHDGYFVSNQFEPDAPTSFVIARDSAAFDSMFGVARVMRDQAHRLAPDAFEKSAVVAAIHRGKEMVTYANASAAIEGRTLVIRYTAKSERSDSAEFSCPLILSVPKDGYDAVQFIENGKPIKAIKTGASSAFEIHSKEPDTVTVTEGDGQATVTIQGGRGIGSATIGRADGKWPGKVVIQARTGGLEKFVITSGRIKLSASVLSHSGNQRLLHFQRDGKEEPQLKPDSEYWMEIRTLDATGKPVAGLPPSKGGYFEMIIPPALLTGTKEVILDWINFFR